MEQMPSESHFGPSSPRYSQFSGLGHGRQVGSIWAKGHQVGPKISQNTTKLQSERWADFARKRGQWTPPVPVSERPVPVLVI